MIKEEEKIRAYDSISYINKICLFSSIPVAILFILKLMDIVTLSWVWIFAISAAIFPFVIGMIIIILMLLIMLAMLIHKPKEKNNAGE